MRLSVVSLKWRAAAAAVAGFAALTPAAALAASDAPAAPAAPAAPVAPVAPVAPAAPAGPAGPVARAAAAAPVPACATSGLVIWLTSNGVAAGTAFYTLNFTNLSGHACTLVGHPGVAAVSLTGHQVGAPAGWEPPAAHVVRLANDATGYALIRYSDVITGGGGPKPCDAVLSAGLRVFPPGQTAAKQVPLPLPACTRPHVVYMNVEPVQKTPPVN